MPMCRSTLCAIPRCRIAIPFSSSKTLVPFLYQTATIQQWKPNLQPIGSRSASSRSSNRHDVPFEDEDPLPPGIEEVEQTRKTTITAPEREAFEKLYRKYGNGEQPQDEIPFSHEVDQIADEWYEEDDEMDGKSDTLDSLFDAVLQGLPPPGQVSKYKRKVPSSDSMDSLQSLAEKILRPERGAAKNKLTAGEAARIKSIREGDKARVRGLLEKAQTDRELWEILDREVFEKFRKLDLDGIQKSKKQQSASMTSTGQSKSASDTTNTAESVDMVSESSKKLTTPSSKPQGHPELKDDPRILFPNFPSHIIYAAQLLRDNFPSSQLPLSILPAIKSLGRSSYALGALVSFS